MSEQATNSPASETPEQAVENMFLRREGVLPEPTGAQGARARNPDGTFAKTGQEEVDLSAAAPAGTEAGDPAEGQEPAPAAAPQSEEVDVEFEIGNEKKTYRIPKEISDRFIQHADYTRKTQDLAELRRVTSAQRESMNVEHAFFQATSAERQQLALVQAQIDQYKGINWGAIEDTGQLIKLREQLNQLKDTQAGLEKTIQAKRGEFEGKIKGLTQEAVQAGMKYIQQHIKGYDEKAEKALHDYGRSQGYSQEELRQIMDPRIVVTLWKSQQFDALMASQPQVLKRAASAAPTVRPGATQKTVTATQRLDKAFKDAKSSKDKAAIAEDYFAARLGGGR